MSIKEIAEKAGVSVATVSRVLNNPNYKCSSSEVRDQIWKAAIALNYTPNTAARNLKMGIQNTEKKVYYIGVLMTRMEKATTDPFFNELLRVIESEIHKQIAILTKVWYMPLFSNDKKCRRENLDQIIDGMYEETDQKCDGLIIIGKCNKGALKKLNQKYKSVVSVNRNSTNYEVDEVLCDGQKVAMMAVEYLISLGHHHIIGIFKADDTQGQQRHKGYVQALQEAGIAYDPDKVVWFYTEDRKTHPYEQMCHMAKMRCEHFFDSVVSYNDQIALEVIRALEDEGLKVPDDVSVTGYDDSYLASSGKVPLTTVAHPQEKLGEMAAELLLGLLKEGNIPESERQILVKPELVIRESCRSRKKEE